MNAGHSIPNPNSSSIFAAATKLYKTVPIPRIVMHRYVCLVNSEWRNYCRSTLDSVHNFQFFRQCIEYGQCEEFFSHFTSISICVQSKQQWASNHAFPLYRFNWPICYICQNRISSTRLMPFYLCGNFTDETLDYLVKCGQTIVNPMINVWYPVCQKTYSNWHDNLLTMLYQVLPSLVMDRFIKSPKHKLMPFVRKIMAMAEVIQFFNHNNFIFANKNYFGVIDR